MIGLARARTQWRRAEEGMSRGAVVAALWLVAFVVRRRNLLFSLGTTVVFFGPALFTAGTYAHYLFSGDVMGWYTPTLEKTHWLLSHGVLTGLDYSRYNGSSDFWLTPIFFYFHPLVILHGLLVPAQYVTVLGAGFAILVICAVHVFIASQSTLVLLQRHFGMGFGLSVSGAVLFAFSLHMVNGLFQPSFLICASLVPWVILGALDHVERRARTSLALAALPVVLCLLGGYMPLGGACLAMCVAIIAAKVLYADAPPSLAAGLTRLVPGITPFLLAVVITAPIVIAIFDFHSASFAARDVSVQFAAHDLAETPSAIVRFLSPSFPIRTLYHEFSFVGCAALALVVGLFFLTPGVASALTGMETRMLHFCLAAYTITVFVVLGNFSPASDLVYYLVPQVGKMHIYQRFLFPAQLLLAIALVLMLKAVVLVRPIGVLRKTTAALVVLAFAMAWWLNSDGPAATKWMINPYVIIEVMMAAVLAATLLTSNAAAVFVVAAFAFGFSSIDRMFDFSVRSGSIAVHRPLKQMTLDVDRIDDFVRYLKDRYRDRAMVKYVDITPIWHADGVETFPKNFPYLVLQKINLSSYTGTPTHISARRDYGMKMPQEGVGILNPSWEYVDHSGADFVIAYEKEIASGKAGPVLQEAYKRAKPGDIYQLPLGVIAMDLALTHSNREPATFDNGFVRVVGPGEAIESLRNLAKGAKASQSSEVGGASASRAVDGKTDGDFNNGSVTHTNADQHAWWEVDLGHEEPIDSVRIWNRVDCCGNRLRDFWVFISPNPFSPRETVQDILKRSDVWKRPGVRPNPSIRIKADGTRGRYVRIQLAGTHAIEEAYISMAEVEVFSTAAGATPGARQKPAGFKPIGFVSNNANHARFEFETASKVDVQYLFSYNPRLVFKVDGRRVESREVDGLLTISVPPGRHEVEIQYRHPLLALWWLVWMGFLGLCGVLAVLRGLAGWRAARAARTVA